MIISDIYGSRFLKAVDLNGKTVNRTIETCLVEEIGGEEKAVLKFKGTDKSFVLNKTNATTLAEIYGPETSEWEGKTIKLVPSTTSYQGKMVKCIRISPERVTTDV